MTFIEWVVFLYIYIERERHTESPQRYLKKEEYHQAAKTSRKINQNSIMGCPLLRNVFAGLILVLLSKGKFL